MGWRSTVLVTTLILSAILLSRHSANGADAKAAAFQAYALTHDGDAERGQAIFMDERIAKCIVCHKVGRKGGEVGPDLTTIGGKFDRPHLIESLLEPSRQIVEGYRSTVVVTTSGQVETGIVKGESTEAITLLDANGKRKTIRAADIDERSISAVSLMPENVVQEIGESGFADLVAYLETLRPGGKRSPGASITGAIRVPEGFQVETVTTGLTGATALETLPDGRILVCEQTGTLRVIKEGRPLEQPFVTLPVDNTWERGLIGVTVDPEFPKSPYVYVCYVAKEPYPHHRISRFTAKGDVALRGSEKVLLEGDNQTKLGGNVPAGHQGGGLHFGSDGTLFVGIGEQTAKTPAQRKDSFLGKILRINADGSIPSDNPFVGESEGKYGAVWAVGLRNPFTFSFSPRGQLFANDVGGEYEEINVVEGGVNYGWPTADHGPTDNPQFRSPVHFYPQASISGGDFAPPSPQLPREYHGQYFFADFVHGWIHVLDPEAVGDQRNTPAAEFAAGLTRPVDLRFGVGGDLYVLLRNAWVIDGKFAGGTGSLLKISRQRG